MKNEQDRLRASASERVRRTHTPIVAALNPSSPAGSVIRHCCAVTSVVWGAVTEEKVFPLSAS
jgi:hypothetical protein